MLKSPSGNEFLSRRSPSRSLGAQAAPTWHRRCFLTPRGLCSQRPACLACPSHSLGHERPGPRAGTWCRSHPRQALVQLQLRLPFEVRPVQALAREQGAEDGVIAQDLVPGHCGETRPSEPPATGLGSPEGAREVSLPRMGRPRGDLLVAAPDCSQGLCPDGGAGCRPGGDPPFGTSLDLTAALIPTPVSDPHVLI